MSVTFYAKDPVESTSACGDYSEAVAGPNWSNGTVATFLRLIGFGDRELWGGEATIVETREAVRRVGRESIDAKLARYGASSSYHDEFAEFLDAAEAAGAKEIYWA